MLTKSYTHGRSHWERIGERRTPSKVKKNFL